MIFVFLILSVAGEEKEYDWKYGSQSNFYLGRYHTNEEINYWLNQNVSTVANVTQIGTTEEKNELYAVTIGNSTKTTVIECGIHAREWISHSFCLFIIHEILFGYYQVSLSPTKPDSLKFIL